MWSHDDIYFSCYCCLGYYVFLLLFYCISPMPFYFYCSCLLCPYLFSEMGKDSLAQCPLRLKFGPFYSLFFIFFLFVLYHYLSASSLGLPLSPYLYLFYITLSSPLVLPFYSPSFLNSLYLLFILHIFFYVMPFVLPLFHLLLFPSLYLLSLSAPLPLSSASPSLLPPSPIQNSMTVIDYTFRYFLLYTFIHFHEDILSLYLSFLLPLLCQFWWMSIFRNWESCWTFTRNVLCATWATCVWHFPTDCVRVIWHVLITWMASRWSRRRCRYFAFDVRWKPSVRYTFRIGDKLGSLKPLMS